jgi:AcrR family transcriptional regulator
MGRPALSQAGVEAFRARATAAALELFGTHAQVSLRQLAKAMGVSPTTPYRYFDSKEHLLSTVRAACYARFAQMLRNRVAPLDDPIERVFAVAASYQAHACEYPAEFRLMFQLGQPDPEPTVLEAAAEAWTVVLDTVADAVEAGRVRADVAQLAHLLWAGVHGIVSLSMSQRLTAGKSAEDLIDPMVSTLLQAHGWHP